MRGGVAESLGRSGKNVTALTIYAGREVFGKLVQLLHRAKPRVRRIASTTSRILWEGAKPGELPIQ